MLIIMVIIQGPINLLFYPSHVPSTLASTSHPASAMEGLGDLANCEEEVAISHVADWHRLDCNCKVVPGISFASLTTHSVKNQFTKKSFVTNPKVSAPYFGHVHQPHINLAMQLTTWHFYITLSTKFRQQFNQTSTKRWNLAPTVHFPQNFVQFSGMLLVNLALTYRTCLGAVFPCLAVETVFFPW